MALLLLSATMVLGILTANRTSSPRWPGFARQDIHRRVSAIALAFLAFHILTSVVDTYVHIGWAALVVPFASSYKRLWVALGAIGVDLLLAVAITSWLRHKMPARTWRAVHWLAYLSWPIALAHSFGMGTDMRQGWVVGVTGVCIAAVVGAGVWRIVLLTTRTRSALGVIPFDRRPRGVPVKHLST
jgi:DMSO/TMAO reductase YedYZ heme-binding membrane subunit